MPPARLTRWSRARASCVRCGRTRYPHWGHGLCRPCYQTAGGYAAAYRARLKKQTKRKTETK